MVSATGVALACLAAAVALTSSASVTSVTVLQDPPVARIRRSENQFFAVTEFRIEAFSFANPASVRWNFTFNKSTCGVTLPFSSSSSSSSAAAASSTSGSTSESTAVGDALRSMVVLNEDRLLVYCASRLLLLNARDGSVLKEHPFLDGSVVVQFSVVDVSVVVLGLLPSAQAVVFNVDRWQPLWSRQGNQTMPPIVCGSAGIVVIVDFTTTFGGFVQGYVASTAKVVFNVTMVMGTSPKLSALPEYSSTVFAWFGPDFASVRTVFIPTGAFWQYEPPFVMRFISPTNDGLLVVSSTSVVSVLDVPNQALLWSREFESQSLTSARVSYDGVYLMLQGDMTAPTIVVELRTGTYVGTCGTAFCAAPCAVGVPSQGVVVLTNCTPQGAQLTLLNNKSFDVVLGVNYSLTTDPIIVNALGPIGNDLIAAVNLKFDILRVLGPTDVGDTSSAPSSWTQSVVAVCVVVGILMLAFVCACRLRKHLTSQSARDSDSLSSEAGLRTAWSIGELVSGA